MAHAFLFIYFSNRICLAPRSLSLSVHALRCKYRVHTHDLPIFDGDISLAAACVCVCMCLGLGRWGRVSGGRNAVRRSVDFIGGGEDVGCDEAGGRLDGASCCDSLRLTFGGLDGWVLSGVCKRGGCRRKKSPGGDQGGWLSR